MEQYMGLKTILTKRYNSWFVLIKMHAAVSGYGKNLGGRIVRFSK